jgi:pimeloyl-ACP methyl ester carboxylesterase
MDQVESHIVHVPVIALGEAHRVAVRVYKIAGKTPAKAVFCFPGGTYNKSYFDIPQDRGENYSLARTLAQAGHIVICIDHPGTGESSRPANGYALTRTVIADCDAAAVKYVTDGLVAGTLVQGWGPFVALARVGVGHSLGGLILLCLQARHACFDAIAVLGWTNQPMSVAHRYPPSEPYVHIDRTGLRPFFHMADVPEHIIVADDRNAEPVPAGILVEGQQAGISLADARSVVTPVFLCFGQRDGCPDPHLEPSTYPNSDDVTLFQLRNSAHNHNFASTRLELFRRLASWIADCKVCVEQE